ncbi:hypothetical protein EJ04DRAFT_573673 [Polyplosphaeria fusca]|uniref:Uncharacterized protein n=1 Tax=Polyplosphaeria fusca TaxID=682080 RepID=A0A9P4R513_9PLEO|nr:hypothetical protein EJ04DRAFT_573673 [Polyplosphaeria fusca]
MVGQIRSQSAPRGSNPFALLQDNLQQQPVSARQSGHQTDNVQQTTYELISSQATSRSPKRSAVRAKTEAWLNEIPRPIPTSANILVLTQSDRENLIHGPRISLCINNIPIDAIPTNLFLRISHRFRAVHTTLPETRAVNLAPNTEPDAIRYITRWLRATSKQDTATSLPSLTSVRDQIAVCHAAHILGLPRAYYAHQVRYLRKYFGRCIPTYRELHTLEMLSTPRWNMLLACAAKNLRWLARNDEVPDPEVFAEFLARHPRIREAVEGDDGDVGDDGDEGEEEDEVDEEERSL